MRLFTHYAISSAHTICVYDKFGLRALLSERNNGIHASEFTCVCVCVYSISFIAFALKFFFLLLFKTICHRSHLLFIIYFYCFVCSLFPFSFASFVRLSGRAIEEFSVFV